MASTPHQRGILSSVILLFFSDVIFNKWLQMLVVFEVKALKSISSKGKTKYFPVSVFASEVALVIRLKGST